MKKQVRGEAKEGCMENYTKFHFPIFSICLSVVEILLHLIHLIQCEKKRLTCGDTPSYSFSYFLPNNAFVPEVDLLNLQKETAWKTNQNFINFFLR